MRRVPSLYVFVAIVAVVVALGCGQQALEKAAGQQQAAAQASPAPESAAAFQVDASWPKELPNKWLMGQVIGVAVDSRDHIWVLHRPRTLTKSEQGAALNPPTSDCCVPAPAVIEFDQEDRKSTRLNSSHIQKSRMPSSA